MDRINMLRYWRNSLADAQFLNIEDKEIPNAIKITIKEIEAGQINKIATKKIIQKARYSGTLIKGKKDDEYFAEIHICPIILRRRIKRNVEDKAKDLVITPLWIPALLSMEGHLTFKQYNRPKPWIPREYLKPNSFYPITLGDTRDVEYFETLHPMPKTELGWLSFWEYCNLFFKYCTKQELTSFNLKEYETDPYPRVIAYQNKQGMSNNIIELYDHLIKKKNVPKLLERFVNTTDETLLPLLTETEEKKMCLYHTGQMQNKFPLSFSQREALHHSFAISDANILAVNGPPGTGKTTLIHSIVASLWVNAAINQEDPPIIVVSSTNNAAVTNVIDSFSTKTAKKTLLSKRWLNGVSDYGLYCTSQSSANKDNYHAMDIYDSPFPKTMENPDLLFKNKEYFLECISEFAGSKFENISNAKGFLHKRLIATYQAISNGLDLFNEYSEILMKVKNKYGDINRLNSLISEHQSLLSATKKEMEKVSEITKGWLNHFSTEPFWMTLFSFFPPVKQRLTMRNRQYNLTTGYAIDVDYSKKEHIINCFDKKLLDLKMKKESVKVSLKDAKYVADKLATQTSRLNSWAVNHGVEWKQIPVTLYQFLDHVDTSLRYKAFLLTTHYWESRWLMDMEKLVHKKGSNYAGRKELEAKWRRYTKLTPCLVSTLHMLPRFFSTGKDTPHLYEFIDLLIIDEAGQVLTEVAGASFSLAKRALIVGDMLQIEPVWSIGNAIDTANIKEYLGIDSLDAIKEMHDLGMTASKGCVMKIAQRSSKFQKHPDENGMFLSEHRRCFDEVIQFCNELAYKNKLEPKRGSPPDNAPLPCMGHKTVKGVAKKSGTSWVNEEEAQRIAIWINQNKTVLTAYYNNKDIDELVGVITPFNRQAKIIRRYLNRNGLKKVEAGTVHTFQGAEKPIIIMSSVYGDSEKNQGFFFDRSVNMLNVAVSRAQDSFLVFGNTDIFKKNGPAPSNLLANYILENKVPKTL